MIYVHDAGAVLLFGSGALYCWVQCCLTYKLTQLGINSQFLFAVRFILTCVITAFGSIFFVAEIFAFEVFRHQTAHVVANWQPSDPGYSVHVLSNVSEWIAALCFGLFGITFFEEFQKISARRMQWEICPGTWKQPVAWVCKYRQWWWRVITLIIDL